MDRQRRDAPTAGTGSAARAVVARGSERRREKGRVVALVPRAARKDGPGTPIAAGPGSSFVRDSYASTAFAEIIDRSVHAAAARFTAGLSPMAMIGAYMDWATHLAFSPGKQMRLVEKAVKKAVRLANYAGRRALRRDGAEPCIEPLPQDRRFDGAGMAAAAVQPDLPGVPAARSSGGTTRRPACAASPGSTRTWSRSRRARCSTCSRRRTFRSPIPRCSQRTLARGRA